jgi:hypothetical protein
MPRLRALTDWSGRKKGEQWDASDDEARILCALDLPGGRKAELVDRVMTAADNPELTEKGRYARRDMRVQK